MLHQALGEKGGAQACSRWGRSIPIEYTFDEAHPEEEGRKGGDMKRWICFAAIALVMASVVHAATEAEKRAAIDAGLAWLASTQNTTSGYWNAGDVYYDTSATGSALLAFLEEKDNWGANAAAYQTVVDKGFDYLMTQAQVVSISSQPAGNPDGDGNGKGLKFVLGLDFCILG